MKLIKSNSQSDPQNKHLKKIQLTRIKPLKALLIMVLGLATYGCTTNDADVNTEANAAKTEVAETVETTQTDTVEMTEQSELKEPEQDSAEVLKAQQLAEQKKQEQAERLLQQKRKSEAANKLAKEKALRLAQQKAQQKAKHKAEAERLAKEQRIAAQKAKEQEEALLAQQAADRVAQEQALELARVSAEQEANLLAQQKQEQQARIEQALNRFTDANYALLYQKDVKVGDVFEVEVNMQLAGELQPVADFFPDDDLALGKVNAQEFLQMKLTSSNASALTINQITEESQSISGVSVPTFKWSVSANKKGTYSLFLNVMPLLNIQNPDGSLIQNNGDNKTIKENIEVATPSFNFWAWINTKVGMIISVIVLILIGLLVKTLMARKAIVK